MYSECIKSLRINNKFQFANNAPIFFTIHYSMPHKTGGNKIHGDELDFHLLKMQSIVMKMF